MSLGTSTLDCSRAADKVMQILDYFVRGMEYVRQVMLELYNTLVRSRSGILYTVMVIVGE